MHIFVARPSVSKLLLMLIAAVAFVCGGIWAAGIFGDVPKPGKEWVGWLSLVFFGSCAIVIFLRLFDRDDQIRISALGIYSKQWSRDTVPWSEISHVSVWEFKKQQTILLHLKSPQRFPSTTLLGKLAVANRALTGGDIALNLVGTDKSIEEAMTAINHFRFNLSSTNATAATNTSLEFGKRGL